MQELVSVNFNEKALRQLFLDLFKFEDYSLAGKSCLFLSHFVHENTRCQNLMCEPEILT